MHIEPGLVVGPKIILSYATAAVAAGYTAKLAWQTIREQGAATSDIARNIEQIARMSEENANAAEDSASAARHLQQLSTNLNDSVRRFRLK